MEILHVEINKWCPRSKSECDSSSWVLRLLSGKIDRTRVGACKIIQIQYSGERNYLSFITTIPLRFSDHHWAMWRSSAVICLIKSTVCSEHVVRMFDGNTTVAVESARYSHSFVSNSCLPWTGFCYWTGPSMPHTLCLVMFYKSMWNDMKLTVISGKLKSVWKCIRIVTNQVMQSAQPPPPGVVEYGNLCEAGVHLMVQLIERHKPPPNYCFKLFWDKAYTLHIQTSLTKMTYLYFF